MKVKKVDEIVIKMAPWELERLLTEIATVVAAFDRNSPQLFPLGLHDFRDELKDLL